MSRTTRRIRTAVFAAVAFGAVMSTAGNAFAYDARITKADLREAGATRTAGGGYALNGRVYDCGGAGYCRPV